MFGFFVLFIQLLHEGLACSLSFFAISSFFFIQKVSCFHDLTSQLSVSFHLQTVVSEASEKFTTLKQNKQADLIKAFFSTLCILVSCHPVCCHVLGQSCYIVSRLSSRFAHLSLPFLNFLSNLETTLNSIFCPTVDLALLANGSYFHLVDSINNENAMFGFQHSNFKVQIFMKTA